MPKRIHYPKHEFKASVKVNEKTVLQEAGCVGCGKIIVNERYLDLDIHGALCRDCLRLALWQVGGHGE